MDIYRRCNRTGERHKKGSESEEGGGGRGGRKALPLSDTRVFSRSWLHPLLEMELGKWWFSQAYDVQPYKPAISNCRFYFVLEEKERHIASYADVL